MILILTNIFSCGEHGHIKADCPNNENKERAASKKGEKKDKAKKSYIAWEDNEVFHLVHLQEVKKLISA